MENWAILGIVVATAQAVVSGFLCHHLAGKKGYGQGVWFVLGFFFGVLGLIACAGLPLEYDASNADFVGKRCPRCDERVRVKASICRFCHHEFNERTDRRRIDVDNEG